MDALQPLRFVRRRAAALPKWANAGAWFFIAFSLSAVGWALARQWADPSGTTTLYGSDSHGAWALTYTGVVGLLLALVQLTTIGAAALVTAMPRMGLGRLGHRVLMGWAALWTLDLVWLASTDLRFESLGQATLMSALLGCTVYRGLRRPIRKPAPAPRETPPEETPVVVADERSTPPAPAAVRAAQVWKTVRSLAKRARPAIRSAFEGARRGIARLQNGWRTTSL